MVNYVSRAKFSPLPIFVNIAFLEHMLSYVLPTVAVFAPGTIWPAKPKMFTNLPFAKNSLPVLNAYQYRV